MQSTSFGYLNEWTAKERMPSSIRGIHFKTDGKGLKRGFKGDQIKTTFSKHIPPILYMTPLNHAYA